VRPGLYTHARRIATRRPEGSRTPALAYVAGEDRWWLWWPCDDCGGIQLPLIARPARATDVRALAARLLPRDCPGCETSCRRSGQGERSPAVWYDTLLDDWVLRLPDGRGSGAILPLEIGWFDAPEAGVYRAASDIAHCGDDLES
jgi:hypothetical protein